MLFVYLLRGRIMWLLGICSTLVDLKAVIFPHRNCFNNENSKNNIGDSGYYESEDLYYDESKISKLMLHAWLTVKLLIGVDLVRLLSSSFTG